MEWIIQSVPADGGVQLEQLWERYRLAPPPTYRHRASMWFRLRRLTLDWAENWSRLSLYQRWRSPTQEQLDGTNNVTEQAIGRNVRALSHDAGLQARSINSECEQPPRLDSHAREGLQSGGTGGELAPAAHRRHGESSPISERSPIHVSLDNQLCRMYDQVVGRPTFSDQLGRDTRCLNPSYTCTRVIAFSI